MVQTLPKQTFYMVSERTPLLNSYLRKDHQDKLSSMVCSNHTVDLCSVDGGLTPGHRPQADEDDLRQDQ
jgi:hypothetical protein